MNPYAVDLEPFFGKKVEEGTTAYAGEPLAPGTAAAPEDAIIEALRTVHDPEIPVNIYDLGLIYAINRQEAGNVHILMTLTAPACPVAGEMPVQVAKAVAAVEGVGEVAVELTWEPAWTTERMSEDAKMALDIF
ncbi:MAG: SUF system Fe-S cluster assembly protein [Alphaproteobacteria bacterium]|nr:SUF system Fe-S cluster assembly protein [Alphaproteobacteria bacterium]MBU0798986.1 SUF system Fe-S cluster assembly protein [Alphaproteobacteria bacterium]MBU0887745.1 SUF system Fe-S cluster assembly protein [Alphaproteobacteria bacterium]MBU1815032.1 SUF system Fe-S cluster assembly protein [Alphaproteobacteria bacterium]MBU2090187.1 SUF system Fe-S cluster assembly protein [Alphaproteobacteria bacterium]